MRITRVDNSRCTFVLETLIGSVAALAIGIGIALIGKRLAWDADSVFIIAIVASIGLPRIIARKVRLMWAVKDGKEDRGRPRNVGE